MQLDQCPRFLCGLSSHGFRLWVGSTVETGWAGSPIESKITTGVEGESCFE